MSDIFDPDPDLEFHESSWRVTRVQTGRGMGRDFSDPDSPVEDLVNVVFHLKGLGKPASFLFSADEAEQTARAMLDTVERARRGQPL